MFKWFSAKESERFGTDLADFVLAEFNAATSKDEKKFAAKAERTLLRAEARLQEFKARERLNFYKKAKLANAFLWTLRDKGCPDEQAKRLTDWISTRM